MDAWREQITTYGGVGLIAGLALILLLIPLLPRGERRRVKLPALLLAVHLGILALRTLVVADAAAQQALYITSIFFLLASIARSTHLLLVHSLVKRMSSGPLPRIVGDLIQAIFFLMAVLVTMHAAGVELGSILTTSALLTAVIGLSLQDTLGNLFAGLAIQLQQPFRVGDWIQWDDNDLNIGRVTEMNWRAVTVVTLEHVEITVPNATLAKAGLSNFSAPAKEARRHVVVWAPPDHSPREIQRALILSLDGVKGVLSSPRPSAITLEFTERGVAYALRYFIRDFERRDIIAGEVRDRVWYALDRLGITIPAPMRTVHLHEVTEESLEHEEEQRVEHLEDELRAVGFLDVLPSESLHRLAEKVEERRYAPGERIIREGDEGEELFIVRAGRVRVEVGGRRRKEVARLGKGQFFGEMSLMTGAERRASVSAVDEVVVLVIGKSALRPVLSEAPELAELISEALAERQLELEEADSRETLTEMPVEQSGVLLQRIKRFFSLGQNDD
jgi:small-conductance mechanosensitive channel/CRP-like cAMP-binding protein